MLNRQHLPGRKYNSSEKLVSEVPATRGGREPGAGSQDRSSRAKGKL